MNVNINNGWNELLLKITQGSGGWEASVAIVDEMVKQLLICCLNKLLIPSAADGVSIN